MTAGSTWAMTSSTLNLSALQVPVFTNWSSFTPRRSASVGAAPSLLLKEEKGIRSARHSRDDSATETMNEVSTRAPGGPR